MLSCVTDAPLGETGDIQAGRAAQSLFSDTPKARQISLAGVAGEVFLVDYCSTIMGNVVQSYSEVIQESPLSLEDFFDRTYL